MSGMQLRYAAYLGILALVFALALWKGELPEKLGGAFNLGAGALASAVYAAMHGQAPEDILELGLDAALAAGFLFLALRYGALWVGMALLLQAVQFSLHAYYLVSSLPHDFNYKLINNLDTDGIDLCILLGVVMVVRQRMRSRTEAPTGSIAAH